MEIREAEAYIENFIKQVKENKADFNNDSKQVEEATKALKKELRRELTEGTESPDHLFYFFVSQNMTKESSKDFDGNVNSLHDLVVFNHALDIAVEQNQEGKKRDYESFLRELTQEKQKFMDKSIEM